HNQLVPVATLALVSPRSQGQTDVIAHLHYSLGKHQLAARFLFNQATFINPVNSTQAVFNQNEPVHNRKIALSDVWTVNNTAVNDFRLQYSYFSQAFLNPCTACPPDTTVGALS